MFRKFLIKKDERGLLFRKGDFITVLHAGEHRYFDLFMRLTVEKYPLAKTAFDHRLADYLRHAEPALVDSEFHVVELGRRGRVTLARIKHLLLVTGNRRPTQW